MMHDLSVLLKIMDILTIIVRLIFMIVVVAIASKKNRNLILWAITGFCIAPVSLLALLFFGDLEAMSEEKRNNSKKLELAFCLFSSCWAIFSWGVWWGYWGQSLIK